MKLLIQISFNGTVFVLIKLYEMKFIHIKIIFLYLMFYNINPRNKKSYSTKLNQIKPN